MKVFNLRCPSDHVFEGWFASESEFETQKGNGWLSCPLCSSTDIVKGLSAPRVARKSNTRSPHRAGSDAADAGAQRADLGELQRVQKAWMAMSRHVIANTDDVGPSFASVARQMHEGDVEERPIRGTATPDERQALADDGIEVMPLLIPDAAKHPLQ